MREFSRKTNPFELILDLEEYWSDYLEDIIPVIRKKKWEKPSFDKMVYPIDISEKEWEDAEIQLRLSLYYYVSSAFVSFFPAFTLVVTTGNNEKIVGCIDDIENYNYGDPLALYIDPDDKFDFDTHSYSFIRANGNVSNFRDFEIMDAEDDSTIVFDNPSPDSMRDYMKDDHGRAVTDHLMLFHINIAMQHKYRHIFQNFLC